MGRTDDHPLGPDNRFHIRLNVFGDMNVTSNERLQYTLGRYNGCRIITTTLRNRKSSLHFPWRTTASELVPSWLIYQCSILYLDCASVEMGSCGTPSQISGRFAVCTNSQDHSTTIWKEHDSEKPP